MINFPANIRTPTKVVLRLTVSGLISDAVWRHHLTHCDCRRHHHIQEVMFGCLVNGSGRDGGNCTTAIMMISAVDSESIA